jgi:hypothetical protein
MAKVKQAEGMDRIPNRAMWSGIFGAAGDGVRFIKAKATGSDPTYASL